MVGFDYGLDRSTAQLSGGEMQRLALAGVLANRPGLLLLDEPTANLDPAGSDEIRAAVQAVLEAIGATLVLVEHRIDAWLPLIDRVVVLDAAGGLLADGSPEQVFARRTEQLSAAGIWWPGRRYSQPAAPSMTSRPSAGTPLIVADQVRVRYRGSAVDAVRSCDLTLRTNGVTALVGRNGSGKSSLAGVIAGLSAPTQGRVVGTDVPERRLHRRRPASLARLVGTVFQNPEHQFLTGSVRAELELAPRLLHLDQTRTATRVDALLERLRLTDLARANPFTLSGGQKRRLSVGTALSAAAPVLILDEPTFGQDANTWHELVGLLRELRADAAAMLVVSHDEQFVDAVADEVRTMADGALGVR